jgi:hypothetical protein
MDILAALKREEARFEQLADTMRQQLETVRAAINLFGGTKSRGKTTGKTTGKTAGIPNRRKNVMSAATKAKIAKAAKKRWAKIKAEKKGKA